MTQTISTPDLNTIRRRIGDTEKSPVLSSAVIDALYVSDSQGRQDVDRTTFFALQELVGMAVNLFAISDPVLNNSTAQRNQVYEQRERLLAYWGRITGLGLSGVTRTASLVSVTRQDRSTEEDD